MSSDTTKVVIGMDLGDKWSNLFVLHRSTGEVEERRIATTAEAVTRTYTQYEHARVAVEVGTHSPWVSRLLAKLGHEVVVANPRMLGLIHADRKKDDASDAQKLALLADYNPALLHPIQHRDPETQAALAVIRARDALVRTRSLLINHVRGAVKSAGGRIVKCSAPSFGGHALPELPEALRPALELMVEHITATTVKIREYDRKIEALNEKYLATARLRQVKGVGAVTGLAFVLVLANPLRFRRGRDVGAYVGLVGRRHQTGGSDPELGITKAGDQLLRRLLVQSAHYILGPFGEDCDLRRWGMALAARGRKNAKKRAVVAVARKLAVLLHHLWVSGETYDPLRVRTQRGEKKASALVGTREEGTPTAAQA